MNLLNPYLNFNGNTEEAFNHYKSVFGGEFAMVMRFKDTEACKDMPADDQNLIMHIALPIGGNILMGSDVPEHMAQAVFGNSLSLSMHAESREDADRMYAALSEGGKASMPMSDMFWGDYWGMLIDKFGINWMISFNAQQHQK
jgi:PhnB protein